jgi:xylan 1,4-beta-xylosidase
LIWNLPAVKQTHFTGGDWELDENIITETVTLEGLKGRFKITETRLDKKKGNAYRQWQAMGSPKYLAKTEMAKLQKGSEPEVRKKFVKAAGSLKLEFKLTPCSIILVAIDKG